MIYDKLWRLNVSVKAVDLRRYPDIYELEELPIERPFALTVIHMVLILKCDVFSMTGSDVPSNVV